MSNKKEKEWGRKQEREEGDEDGWLTEDDR